MFAFANVSFEYRDTLTGPVLNKMVGANLWNSFFTRTIGGDTLVIHAPSSFSKWLKTSSNVLQLLDWGTGPGLGATRQKSFDGLYWREDSDKTALYVLFEGRTIPWKSWTAWCEKQQELLIKNSKKKSKKK
jgi:hypothetical protein